MRRLQLENHPLPLQPRQAAGPPLQPAHLMAHLPALMTHPHHHHPALVVRHPVQMENPLHPVLTVR